MSKDKRKKSLALAAAGVSLAGVGIYSYMRNLAIKLVTNPSQATSDETPTDYNLPFEETWFDSRDGIRLHGWFVPAPNSRATIILGHGHVSSKEPSLSIAAFLWRAGYSIFMFDFRGHGRNQRGGVSIGYKERMDVHGAVDYLVGRGENRLGYLGFSMGAAIGIIAAAENPLIQAVIADSAFAHLNSSVTSYIRLKQKWVPIWLARWLARFTIWTVAGHFGYHHRLADPVNFVTQIAPRPLFIIHGELDRLTPLENAQELYQAARDPKELWVQTSLPHCCGFEQLGPAYEQRILDFLAQVEWATSAFTPKNFQPIYL